MTASSLRFGLELAICPSINGGGQVIADLSLRKNRCFLNNMDANDYVARRGRQLNFNGVNKFLNCGNSQALSFAGNQPFTFGAWVELANLPGNALYGIGSRGQYNRDLEYNFYIGESTNRVRATLGDGANNLRYIGRSTEPITDTSFRLFCFTYDGTATSTGVRIYIAGVRSDTTNYESIPWTSMTNLGATISLGALNQGGNFWMNGRMDDMRIYRRNLSEQEIGLWAREPGFGLRPDRTSVFFGAQFFNAAWARNSNVILSPVGAA